MTAEAMINSFAARTGTGAFVGISRLSVAAGLRIRVKHPEKINQGETSLCGPAALLYSIAKRDSIQYVTFVIDLYEHGKARLGSMNIDPKRKLETHTPPQSSVIDPADWIPLASIRNTSRFLFARYDSANEQLAAVTTPGKFTKWLKDVGYLDTTRRTDMIPPVRSSASLREAERFLNMGYVAFLLIHKGLVEGVGPSQVVCTTPNDVVANHAGVGMLDWHWIVLDSVSWNGSGDVKMRVYSWGDERRVPDCGWLPYRTIEKYYRGFIAARY